MTPITRKPFVQRHCGLFFRLFYFDTAPHMQDVCTEKDVSSFTSSQRHILSRCFFHWSSLFLPPSSFPRLIFSLPLSHSLSSMCVHFFNWFHHQITHRVHIYRSSTLYVSVSHVVSSVSCNCLTPKAFALIFRQQREAAAAALSPSQQKRLTDDEKVTNLLLFHSHRYFCCERVHTLYVIAFLSLSPCAPSPFTFRHFHLRENDTSINFCQFK